ncbi:hypothetical protein ACMA5I_03830 [Paracoccaceae bacterium GXU_MW_L88]
MIDYDSFDKRLDQARAGSKGNFAYMELYGKVGSISGEQKSLRPMAVEARDFLVSLGLFFSFLAVLDIILELKFEGQAAPRLEYFQRLIFLLILLMAFFIPMLQLLISHSKLKEELPGYNIIINFFMIALWVFFIIFALMTSVFILSSYS